MTKIGYPMTTMMNTGSQNARINSRRCTDRTSLIDVECYMYLLIIALQLLSVNLSLRVPRDLRFSDSRGVPHLFPRHLCQMAKSEERPEKTQKNTLLTSHGRLPWYGEDGIPIDDAFVLGIAGGSASGKVTSSSLDRAP